MGEVKYDKIYSMQFIYINKTTYCTNARIALIVADIS